MTSDSATGTEGAMGRARDACARLAGRRWLGLLGFLALAFVLYAPAIQNAFVFDDNTTLRRNEVIRDPMRLLELFRLTGQGYRPVRYLSFALDYAIGGDAPWVYHIFNSLYHGLVAFLVWRVILRLSGDALAGLAGALLFTLHPAHTECAAYISGRRDLLTTLFYLAAFLSYLRCRDAVRALGEAPSTEGRGPLRSAIGWALASIACFALALGSKEMAVTFPAMVVLHALVIDGRALRSALTPGRAAALGLFLAVLAAIAGFAVWWTLSGDISGRLGPWGRSWDVQGMTAVRLVAHYAWLCVFPVRLLADYSLDAFPLSRSPLEPGFIASVAALAALAALAAACIRRAPLVAFGIAWFFLALAPVSQIVPYHELGADHYIYLPSVGFCLLAGLGSARLHDRRGPALAIGVTGIVLLALAVRTEVRIPDWRTQESIFRATVATAPRCARANLNLGMTIAARGGPTKKEKIEGILQALPYYDAAIDSLPDYIYAHFSRANVLAYIGRDAAARADLERALALSRATVNPRISPEELLMSLGRVDEAIAILEPRFQDGSATGPDLVRLARCRAAQRDVSGALDCWERAVELSDRDESSAAEGLKLSMKSGQLGRIVWFYERLKALNPARAEELMGGSLRRGPPPKVPAKEKPPG